MFDAKEIQQLISDAGLALESLDSGLEGSEAEQKSLGQALSDCSGELQRQMAAAFVERRGKLQDERAKLQKRFEELNAEITQLDTEVRRCNGQVQQLQAQFSQNTSHYDGLLGGSSNVAMKLCERKSKAIPFWQHRGFGVHLSFVRSVAMDRWTPTQLRTMEVGGTERFLKFFSHYPRLKGRNRYASKAARFYKRRLDAEVSGQTFQEDPPEEAEASLPEETDLTDFDANISRLESILAQQLGRSRPRLRFRHIPSFLLHAVHHMKELRHDLVGCFLTFSGLVASMSSVKVAEFTRSFECSCVRPPEAGCCGGCGGDSFKDLGGAMIDYQEIRLQDTGLQNCSHAQVVLCGELVSSCVPGDLVVVCGVLRARWPNWAPKKRLMVQLILDARDLHQLHEAPRRSLVAMPPAADPWQQRRQMSTAGRGLVPRTAAAVLEALATSEFTDSSVTVSYLEIYNEELSDLLAPTDRHQKLDLKDIGGGRGVCCQGLSEVPVHSMDDILEVVRRAQEKRRVAETRVNARSSRSHSIFTMKVRCQRAVAGGELENQGKLHLVDLAGSECAKKGGLIYPEDVSASARLLAGQEEERERRSINQSLLTLGRVITALREGSGRVPYRDSKLTRLLQDALGGRCKTVIIATISPALASVEETISALSYAEQAAGIRNRPVASSLLRTATVAAAARTVHPADVSRVPSESRWVESVQLQEQAFARQRFASLAEGRHEAALSLQSSLSSVEQHCTSLEERWYAAKDQRTASQCHAEEFCKKIQQDIREKLEASGLLPPSHIEARVKEDTQALEHVELPALAREAEEKIYETNSLQTAAIADLRAEQQRQHGCVVNLTEQLEKNRALTLKKVSKISGTAKEKVLENWSSTEKTLQNVNDVFSEMLEATRCTVGSVDSSASSAQQRFAERVASLRQSLAQQRSLLEQSAKKTSEALSAAQSAVTEQHRLSEESMAGALEAVEQLQQMHVEVLMQVKQETSQSADKMQAATSSVSQALDSNRQQTADATEQQQQQWDSVADAFQKHAEAASLDEQPQTPQTDVP
eukprot:g16463.t1